MVEFAFGIAPTMRISADAVFAVKQQQDTTQRNSRRAARRANTRPTTDTISAATATDTIPSNTIDSIAADTTRKAGSSLGNIITGSATDSLYYDMRNKMVYIYSEGDVTYDNMNLKADFMNINLDSKNIYAYGKADTLQDGTIELVTPTFTQGESTMNMDTITYNIESQRAKVKGIRTQQGDGWLIGHNVKKMEDNSINIADGMYTTCDQTDHPHFYYYMSKAKVITGDKGKVIMGPGHIVIEDVSIPFLGLPEGFFPLSTGPKSGILMPTYGEEADEVSTSEDWVITSH